MLTGQYTAGISHAVRARRPSGFTLVEVLVTLVILLFGLLGIAGLMAKGQKASYEAYQRQAALAFANDMAERVKANRTQADVYRASADIGSPMGTGLQYAHLLDATTLDCGSNTCSAANLVAYDLALWDGLLQGYGELNSGGSKVGGIVNARGCIEDYDAAAGVVPTASCPAAPAPIGYNYMHRYRVSVTWQGQDETATPTTTQCGQNLYGTEPRRRAVTMDLIVQNQCP